MTRDHAQTLQSGFSLVEALVALVVGGLVISAALVLVLGQNRYHYRMEDQIWAEQTLRATVDLMASELNMASGRDLISAEAESVSVRFDSRRAVVCDSTGIDEVALADYDSVSAWGLATGFTGTALSEPTFSAIEYADGFQPTTTSSGSAPKSICTGHGAPATLSGASYWTAVGWRGAFRGALPERGTLIRVYGRLTYRFAPSTFFPSLDALWRGAQEMTGPFDDGAAFSYVMDDGSERSRVEDADLGQVRAVRITSRAVGQAGPPPGTSRGLRFDVRLRN